MRVLITGGLGCIGSLLAAEYLKRGDEVQIIDPGAEPRQAYVKEQMKSDKLHLKKASLQQVSATWLYTAVDRSDLIIHAAASTGIPWSMENPVADWSDNVDGTLALLEAARLMRDGCPPIVILSSVKPYAVPAEGPLTEGALLVPDEPYAASKAAQSMMAMAWARTYGLPIVTFRCSNLYGPAPCAGPRHGWLTWFCIQAALGWPIEVQGTGGQTRDMLFHSDVFSAIAAAVRELGSVRGQTFNLGGGATNQISVKEAMWTLRSWSGCGATEADGRRRDDMRVCASTAAFHAATDWTPQVGVVDGMQAIYKWACQHKEELRKIYARYEPTEDEEEETSETQGA